MPKDSEKSLAPNVKGGPPTHVPVRGYPDHDFELNLDPNDFEARVVRKEGEYTVTYHRPVWHLVQYGYKSNASRWGADLEHCKMVTWE